MARTFAILLSARGVLPATFLLPLVLEVFFALLDFDLVAAIFSFSLWDILAQIAAI
jgi:hypothetical protein